jgi:hypothetical protein
VIKGERRPHRRQAEVDTAEQDRLRAPAPPHAAVLALQRSAGNAAVSSRLVRPTRPALARVTDKQISDRAAGIWEEKGSPANQTTEQQAADWGEGTRQAGAMERETTRRAAEAHQARGGGPSTDAQAAADWTGAEKGIAKDFICARTDDWKVLLAKAALWTGVPAGAAQTELTAIKSKLTELQEHLDKEDDLGARLTLITAAETLVDAWIASHGSGNGAVKADHLLLLKMHTLAYERRRRLKMLHIQDTYGIKFNSTVGIQRHKAGFTAPGNPTALNQIAATTGLSLFSLEELDMIITVFSNYAPLLGKGRDATLGAQPLNFFTRFKVGLDPGANPATDAPVSSPGDFGVTIGDTITMYDKSSTDTFDFATTQQQFRGTIEHELSHALLEPLLTGGGTMIQKFATDMKFWDGAIAVAKYPSAAAAIAASVEPPPTNYGRKTAQEDLAETMMFFFEDPKDLETRCPKRFKWVKDNLGSVLGPEHMKKINAPPVTA